MIYIEVTFILSVMLILINARVVTKLPASEAQLEDLAYSVCGTLPMENMSDIDICRENFLGSIKLHNRANNLVQVMCQSRRGITFKLSRTSKSTDAFHIVLLTSKPDDDEIINYVILEPQDQYARLHPHRSGDYTFWTIIVDEDGNFSPWHRGPIITHRAKLNVLENKTYDIAVEFMYQNNSRTVQAVLSWNTTDDTDVCFDVKNTCNNLPLGDFFDATIWPNEDRTVILNDLPLDDNCSFQVEGKFLNELTYRTLACDHVEGCLESNSSLRNSAETENTDLGIEPEKFGEVYLKVTESASGNGWDVRVNWTKPSHPPTKYNITLDTWKPRTVILWGNATEVTFMDVETDEVWYNVSLVAVYPRGKAFTSRRARFPDAYTRSSSMVIVTGAWAAALSCGVVLAAFCIWWRRRRDRKLRHLYFQGLEEKISKESTTDTSISESVGADAWEVRPERVSLHEVIGEGAFGVVRRATLAPATREVACKMLKDFPTSEEVRSFRTEMELMKSVGAHPHVVSLVGCCSGRRPLIIAEYCSRGDLLSYLRCSWDVMVSKRNAKYYNNNIETSSYRNDLFRSKTKENTKLVVNKLYDLQGICDTELSSLDLLSFCRQIAKGMEFLASNRVVHRDLAARNILVTSDRTLKIADFGLSRDVYQENQYRQKGNGKMPVKWMALESLTRRIYTTQSDVWSFGVVVWEVVTVGAAPYPAVPAARLPRLLRAGYRMPRPNNCSKQLYEVMLSCWEARPRDRPTFTQLHARLDALLHSACADEYLSLEIDADELPPTPVHHRYVRMLTRGKLWGKGENYERPLKAPQCNHYTTPPAAATGTV